MLDLTVLEFGQLFVQDNQGNRFEVITVVDDDRAVVGNYIVDSRSNLMIEVEETSEDSSAEYRVVDQLIVDSEFSASSSKGFEKMFLEADAEVESSAEAAVRSRINAEVDSEINSKVESYQRMSDSELHNLGVSMLLDDCIIFNPSL